jgi:hypothetical protein
MGHLPKEMTVKVGLSFLACLAGLGKTVDGRPRRVGRQVTGRFTKEIKVSDIKRIQLRNAFLFFHLLFAVPAFAFPDTAVLDQFTGCIDDANPPNANWSTLSQFGSTSGMDCEDQAATGPGGGNFGGAYWNAGTFNANSEAYATIVSTGSNREWDIYVRLKEIGAGTTDGYGVFVDTASASMRPYQINNGVFEALGTGVSITPAVGDSFGVKMVGAQICTWYKLAAGAWTQIECVTTDNDYPAGGFIGMGAIGDETIGQIDNFGGGNVAAATRRPIPPIFFQ